MALDGIVISNLIYDLNRTISGCRISKIAQPETDELMLTCKGELRAGTFRYFCKRVSSTDVSGIKK